MSYKYFGVLAIQTIKEQWQQINPLELDTQALLLELEQMQQKINALLEKK